MAVKYRCTSCFQEVGVAGEIVGPAEIKLGKHDYIDLVLCNACKVGFNGRDVYHDTKRMMEATNGK